MSINEAAAYRLAAAMIEAAGEALTDSRKDDGLQDAAIEVIGIARDLVRDTVGYIDEIEAEANAKLNAKHAPLKEASV